MKYLIVVCMFVATVCRAQTRDILTVLKDTINTVPFVFEGRVESVEVFAGDANGNRLPRTLTNWESGVGYFYDTNGKEAIGYSSATITICRAYKGNLPNQIVVIWKSDELSNVYLEKTSSGDTIVSYLHVTPSHVTEAYPMLLPHPSYPIRKLFFARLGPVNLPAFIEKANYFTLQSVLEAPMDVTAPKTLPDGTAEPIQAYAMIYPHVFETEKDLSKFMSQIKGLDASPLCKCVDPEKKSKKKEDGGEIKINYQQNLLNYDAWLSEKLAHLTEINQNKRPSKSSVVNIAFDIANERLVNIGSNRWFEFDIMASSNGSPVYFDNSNIKIAYNSAAFGTNIVAGNNVVVTRGPTFNTTSYYDPMVLINESFSNTVLTIPFTSLLQTGRAPLTSTPVLMLTVRIKIQTCGQNANIVFTDISASSMFNWYTAAHNSTFGSEATFDNSLYNGNITDKTCEPIITNFTSGMPAGVGNIITIVGKYFGGSRGTFGGVIFKNADQGDRYPVMTGVNNGGVQAYDIISWDHNQIQIDLPTLIDSATILIGSIPAQNRQVTAGSGKFKVRNFTSSVGESATPINIPWAITQYATPATSPPYEKIVASVAARNGDGYKLQVNNYLITALGSKNIKPATKKALHEWTCATGITWHLGADTNAVATSTDVLCIIDTLTTTGPALARTIVDINTCISGSVKHYYLNGFDIKIAPTPAAGIWNVDTTGAIANGELDFFSIISHELGHGHQVSHINDSINDLMWYKAVNTAINANMRKFVKSSPNARNGADWVMDHLDNSIGCGIGEHIPTSPQNCEAFVDTGIRQYGSNNKNIYPNPSTGIFNIDMQGNYRVTVHDIMGRLVGEQEAQGSTTINIDSKGIYIVIIETTTGSTAAKVIVQ